MEGFYFNEFHVEGHAMLVSMHTLLLFTHTCVVTCSGSCSAVSNSLL